MQVERDQDTKDERKGQTGEEKRLDADQLASRVSRTFSARSVFSKSNLESINSVHRLDLVTTMRMAGVEGQSVVLTKILPSAVQYYSHLV